MSEQRDRLGYKLGIKYMRESEDNPVITSVNIRCLYDATTPEGIKTKYLNVTYMYIDNKNYPHSAFSTGIYRKDCTIIDGCTQLPVLINSQVYLHGSDDYRRKVLKKIIVSDSFFFEKVFAPSNVKNLFLSDINSLLAVCPARLRALLVQRTMK